MRMAVADRDGGGSHVDVSTEMQVTGRVAQMGQGIMQDVADLRDSDGHRRPLQAKVKSGQRCGAQREQGDVIHGLADIEAVQDAIAQAVEVVAVDRARSPETLQATVEGPVPALDQAVGKQQQRRPFGERVHRFLAMEIRCDADRRRMTDLQIEGIAVVRNQQRRGMAGVGDA